MHRVVYGLTYSKRDIRVSVEGVDCVNCRRGIATADIYRSIAISTAYQYSDPTRRYGPPEDVPEMTPNISTSPQVMNAFAMPMAFGSSDFFPPGKAISTALADKYSGITHEIIKIRINNNPLPDTCAPSGRSHTRDGGRRRGSPE